MTSKLCTRKNWVSRTTIFKARFYVELITRLKKIKEKLTDLAKTCKPFFSAANVWSCSEKLQESHWKPDLNPRKIRRKFVIPATNHQNIITNFTLTFFHYSTTRKFKRDFNQGKREKSPPAPLPSPGTSISELPRWCWTLYSPYQQKTKKNENFPQKRKKN